MKVPEIIEQWCSENEIDVSDFIMEPGPDFEKVQEEHFCEDKHYNLNEVVVKHVETGRFFRWLEISTPYGLYDYGSDSSFETEIEEVFPVEKTVLVYLTSEEQSERMGK